MGTVTELMEGEVDKDLYEDIFEAVEHTHGVSNAHRVRIRKLGGYYVVDMDVEVDEDLKVKAAHDMVKHLEEKIKSGNPEIYDVIIHIEPHGNHESGEKYGLSEKNIK